MLLRPKPLPIQRTDFGLWFMVYGGPSHGGLTQEIRMH